MARQSSGLPPIKRYEMTSFFYAFDEEKNPHLIKELTAHISDINLGWREGRKKYITTKGEPVMILEDGKCQVIPTGQMLTKVA